MRFHFGILLLFALTVRAEDAPVKDRGQEYDEAVRTAEKQYMSRMVDLLDTGDRVEVSLLSKEPPTRGAAEWPAVSDRGAEWNRRWQTRTVDVCGAAMRPWLTSLQTVCRDVIPNGVLCHDPIHGVRVWKGEELLLSASLCWDCGNIAVCTPESRGGLYRMPDGSLKKLCLDLLPIPSEVAIADRPYKDEDHRLRAGSLPIHECLPVKTGKRWRLKMTVYYPDGNKRQCTIERKYRDEISYGGKRYDLLEQQTLDPAGVLNSDMMKHLVRRQGSIDYSLEDFERGEQTEFRSAAKPGESWPRWYAGVFFTDTVIGVETVQVGKKSYPCCRHVHAESPVGLCTENYWVSPEVGLTKSVMDFHTLGFRTVTELTDVSDVKSKSR